MRQLVIVWYLFIVSFLTVSLDAQAPVTPQDLADADGKFVDVNGISVYYLERGPQDGKPVVLLHGFLGSTVSWDMTINALAAAGFRAIAFDRPPFGLSDKRTSLDYSLSAQAALTADFMTALEIDHAALVGHSAGGPVAAQFALHYPERVDKLVFIAAAIGMDTPFDQEDNGGVLRSLFSEIDPDSPAAQLALRSLLNSGFAAQLANRAMANPQSLTQEMLERAARWTRLPGWEGGLLAFTRDATNEKSQLDLAALDKIRAPILVIWGEEDAVVPISVGQSLKKLLRNEVWITYPHVGHMPMDEVSDRFNADIVAFLR